ncbi:hypothetical protein D5125_10235 [Magnetovirga frankeli]|uniref:hypothetical protein n=1 Tax=Magnetovirga frankeli TaxID=947516 RepID=UPI0012931333|nr:hypothetical protein D5125_10235 [gamma proteobacterium SS-5]
MFAIRQVISDPEEWIAVPPEMRHRPTEVIFIAMDAPAKPPLNIEDDPIRSFCGCGSGGSTERLLEERQKDQGHE